MVKLVNSRFFKTDYWNPFIRLLLTVRLLKGASSNCRYQQLVDNSIGILLKERDQEAAPKGLTQQDLFYREVRM